MNEFPCTKCGACCRRTAVLEFLGFPVKEDGSCEFLTEKNECSIYEKRPWICKVTKDFEYNAMCCNLMQEQEGIDESYRVKIKSGSRTF